MERSQGKDRALMLASFGRGDTNQIRAEEELIYSLNRFNVTASRARAHLIALLVRQLANHLPRASVLEASRLLRYFVDGFLRRPEPIRGPGCRTAELRFR
ncbi:MAG: hypothetical protein OYK82_10820 [Gammaproteobacteria bacterium]|nr:hypothetical protein [Gammaproteobacteria bacterium]